MVDVPIYRWAESRVDSVSVDESAFGDRIRRRVLREAVLMYEANRRVGTASVRTRAEIKGTTKKPWRQKGTGRARAGTKKSPIWRGGGVTHGPKKRDYSYSMPRKSLRVALRSALLGKLRDGGIAFIDEIGLDAPKTRDVAKALDSLGTTGGTTLIVLPEANDVAFKSGRNVRKTDVRVAPELTAHDVLRYRTVVMVGEALDRVKERVAS